MPATGVALEDIEQCVVHLGRHVVLRSGSLFFAGPVWSELHADERRPDGLTYACRRHDVGRIDCPYKRVDPEVMTRGRPEASKGGHPK